jgi:hypothetical protein
MQELIMNLSLNGLKTKKRNGMMHDEVEAAHREPEG